MSELETGTAPAASPAEAIAETPVVETTAAPETSAPATTEAAPETTLDEDLAAVWDKNNTQTARDEQGRFVSKNPDAGEPAEATTDGQTPETVAEPETPEIPAPHSWPTEMKAKWAELPPDAREYIAKRESEAHSQISRMGQTVKAYQPVAETLEQHRDVFERNGMDFQGGIKALLNAQVALEQNPVAAIQHLAGAYGVDLAKMYGGTGEQPSGQPQIAALEAQVAHLNRQLQETSQRVFTREQRETEAQRQTLESVVADFIQDKPDFDAIEADVMALIPAIRGKNPGASPKELLAEAYEQAQWLNPEARARKLEADRKAAEAKAAEEAAKRAAQAKKVSSINVRSSQSSQSDRRTLEAELADVYRRMHS